MTVEDGLLSYILALLFTRRSITTALLEKNFLKSVQMVVIFQTEGITELYSKQSLSYLLSDSSLVARPLGT